MSQGKYVDRTVLVKFLPESSSRILRKGSRSHPSIRYNLPSRVLLVTADNEGLCALTANLKRLGVEADATSSLEGAAASINSNHQELVVLDTFSAKVSVFELCRRMSGCGEAVLGIISPFEIKKSEFLTMFPGINVRFFIVRPLTIRKLVDVCRARAPYA